MTRGMRRKIDPLGRCVIPKEFRTILNIKPGDYVEVSCCEDTLTLTPCQFDLCRQCGKKIESTYRYCPYCGRKHTKT